jgi:hypothetical protein
VMRTHSRAAYDSANVTLRILQWSDAANLSTDAAMAPHASSLFLARPRYIQIYFCNTQINTNCNIRLKTDETFRSYTCNIAIAHMQHPVITLATYV